MLYTLEEIKYIFFNCDLILPRDPVGGFRVIRNLQEKIQPFLTDECNDLEGFREEATEIAAKFMLVLISYEWNLRQEDENPPEEIITYLLTGDGSRFLKLLLERTGGSTCLLEGYIEALTEKDLLWSPVHLACPERYCETLVNFMLNSHMTENHSDSLLDHTDPECLQLVLDFVLVSCGFKDLQLSATLSYQDGHHEAGDREVVLLPSRILDAKLLPLVKTLVDSAAVVKDTRSYAERPSGYNPPLIKAALLYLPSITELLLEHFDVTELGERKANVVELTINALCLDQCSYDCFGDVLHLFLGTRKVRIKTDACLKFLNTYEKKVLSARSSEKHLQKKSLVVLNALNGVFQSKVLEPELIHELIFKTIELFPIFADVYMSDYERVIKNMIECDNFDVGKTYSYQGHEHSDLDSNSNQNILHLIVKRLLDGSSSSKSRRRWAFFEMLKLILEHRSCDVTTEDSYGLTPVDLCVNHARTCPDIVYIHLITLLSQHHTATEEEIYTALCGLAVVDDLQSDHVHENAQRRPKLKVRYTEPGEDFFQMKVRDMYTDSVRRLSGPSDRFDVNFQGDGGSTIAHIASGSADTNVQMMKVLVENANLDPNIQDADGNTPMFLVIRNFDRPEDIGYVYQRVKSKLKLDVKNNAGQTLYDVCDDIQDRSSRKTVEKVVGKHPAIARAADVDATRVPAEIASHVVDLQLAPVHASHLAVRSTTKVAMETVTQNHAKEGLGVYEMKKRKKGKACIISVHEFHVQWLAGLDGYIYDRENLQSLWQQIGFDVYIPQTVHPFNNSQLTKVELEMAVQKFAESLDDEDDCAVLCILSHGGNGFVYGKDGKKAFLDQLLKHFNNENCPKMMDKPKVVIIQACNGNMTDTGQVVGANAGQIVTPAASLEILPTISDTIVIYPSQPGYISYVYTTPGEGSVLIKELTAIFGRYAATDDIHKLLTRLNKAVSDKTFEEGRIAKKQMPRCIHDLRRMLYFFPLGGASENS